MCHLNARLNWARLSLDYQHHSKGSLVRNTLSMAKVISVFLATGAQGKSVVNALLDTGFKVRALTLNLESSGAKSLLEKGCEVVKVDMND